MSPMMMKAAFSGLFLLAALAALIVAITLAVKKSTNGERKRFISQATSGRWLLTLFAGAAFLMLVLATFLILVSMRHAMKPETAVALFSAVLLIIQGVYKDYFQRDRNGKHQDDHSKEDEEDEGSE